MKEIEVKAKIEDFNIILTKLKTMGCKLSQPLYQEDKIFLSKDMEFSDIKKGTNVLRIRCEGDKVKFTLKKPQSNELDCIEREIEVSDSKQMEDIISYLGYKEVVQVNKIRRKCQYKDYKICLDDVENLGKFIEIEKLSEDDALKIQEELIHFLENLGVNKKDRILQGYHTLIYNKK